MGCRRTPARDPNRARRRRRRAGARRPGVAHGARVDVQRRTRRTRPKPDDDSRTGHVASVLADSFRVPVADIDAALLTLETEGVVLRGRFSPGAGRSRVVGSGPARADSPLHVEPAACGDRAGERRRLHALPVPLAARRACGPARRPRRPAGDRGDAGRLRARVGSVGAKRARDASRRLRPVAPRHAVPDGGSRMGAAVCAASRRRHAARAAAAVGRDAHSRCF